MKASSNAMGRKYTFFIVTTSFRDVIIINTFVILLNKNAPTFYAGSRTVYNQFMTDFAIRLGL
ncbi:hypothetical protein QFZ31_003919 [Neobacillus niacini]|nr:hypothetical protein [Neobacillus niacini]